jgi:hypothetical protein
MKKTQVRKLRLNLESLRVLDLHDLTGGATEIKTCQTSCAYTCGVQPATTDAFRAAARPDTGFCPALCV